MARLNEFAAPAESIDALKRRFVRQNREIARVNSMQSLRIRSLESEVSHLLSENVSLREQVITLNQEIERLEAAKLLSDGVYEIKSKLDAKLAELSHLTMDLGMLPRKVNKLCQTAPPANPKTSDPDAHPRTTESDLNAGVDDGRLPAIMEDKYYPRRTLEQQELQDLVQESFSIPESPPEDHAKAETPSSEQQRESVLESRIDNDLVEDPFLPPTLETRKRKKKSESAFTHEDNSAASWRLTPTADSEPARKSGSKRKFSPEEDEFVTCVVEEEDEFQFSRPSHSPRKQTESFDVTRKEHSPAKRPGDVKRELASPALGKRKVLKPSMITRPLVPGDRKLTTSTTESANVNLGSPNKARASQLREHKPPRKVGERDENTSTAKKSKDVDGHKDEGKKTRASRSEHAPQKTKRASSAAEKEETIYIEPALPPEPIVVTLEEEPTKMPGLSGAPARPCRRQRAVVSYAEPNLRDKMRRPTNELMDAVTGAQSRRSSSFHAGRESWSGEGERPAGDKANSGSQSRPTVPADLALADHDPDHFSNNTTSDFLTTVSQRKRKVSATPKNNHDGGESDSIAHEYHATAPTRQSRRHSSNPSTKSPVATLTQADEGDYSLLRDASPEDDVFGLGSKTSSALETRQARRGQRVAARRKSMML